MNCYMMSHEIIFLGCYFIYDCFPDSVRFNFGPWQVQMLESNVGPQTALCQGRRASSISWYACRNLCRCRAARPRLSEPVSSPRRVIESHTRTILHVAVVAAMEAKGSESTLFESNADPLSAFPLCLSVCPPWHQNRVVVVHYSISGI